MKIDVEYTSTWDIYGDVSTTAVLITSTGQVVDIVDANMDNVPNNIGGLVEEYVTYEGNKLIVTVDEDNDYYVNVDELNKILSEGVMEVTSVLGMDNKIVIKKLIEMFMERVPERGAMLLTTDENHKIVMDSVGGKQVNCCLIAKHENNIEYYLERYKDLFTEVYIDIDTKEYSELGDMLKVFKKYPNYTYYYTSSCADNAILVNNATLHGVEHKMTWAVDERCLKN